MIQRGSLTSEFRSPIFCIRMETAPFDREGIL